MIIFNTITWGSFDCHHSSLVANFNYFILGGNPGGGGTCRITHDRRGGVVWQSFIFWTPKNTWVWNSWQKHANKKQKKKKHLASKFSTQKNTGPSTSILIYSIKQTLRPKKYVTDLITQKNTEGANIQPKKIRQTSPFSILQVPPWGWYFTRLQSHCPFQCCIRVSL